jgi:antitoxin component of RelBE/YafQ-DinJ toxin-antitoxin module
MDEQLKDAFLKVIGEIGLDAPSVIRMLAVQTVRLKRVPLSLAVEPENDSSLEFMDSVRADWGEWS